MWDQMKKKLKQVFDIHTPASEEYEKPDKPDRRSKPAYTRESNVEARVAYKYPKERSFKFPMIPDARVQKRDRDNIASQKNEPEKVEKKPEKKTQSKQKPKPVKEKPEPRKPFTPTEVASPIYGYQPRNKNREIDPLDIPAYERKSERNLDIEAGTNLSDEHTELDEKVESTYNPVENPVKQDIQPISSRVVPNPAREENTDAKNRKESVSFHDYKETKEQEHLQVTNRQEMKTEERKTSVSSNENNHKRSDKKRKSHLPDTNRSPNEKSGKTVPFNVIMTPRDKKNHYTQPAVKEKPSDGPPINLLSDPAKKSTADRAWVTERTQLLETTLKHFHVRAKVVNAMSGPSVTRFEIQPEPGVKVSKIKTLSDDIKLNMAARDIRMEAPIPGKNTIGIEVPNPEPQPVGLQEIFESEAFKKETSPLAVALGLDIAGKPIVTNLNKMPHGLIAGATGSGKSVCINSILISLLYKSSYKDVKFLLIDPKMVELAPYNELPHLVAPVITDVKAATPALKWAVSEMEDRYNKFVREGSRDVERYNAKMKQQNREHEKLPYLIIVIDELADLMMVAPHDVEDAICRIAQKARACGIHLLLATQRPSVDVITGLIKANIPTRIAFSVSSQVDSRTIIDTQGAEKLLGRGDMLFAENGSGQTVRIQGAFVSDEEIERVTNYVKKTAPPQYLFEQEQLLEQVQSEEEEDELYEDAVDFIFNHNGASASLLQRRFKIGYNRAARLIDQMEAKGIISEQKGSKPRDVLITATQLEETNVSD